MENALNLVPSSSESLARIEESIKRKKPLADERVLFCDAVHNFPFAIREIHQGDQPGIYILSGVADTLKRGRHHARIEFSMAEKRGRFL